MAAGKNFLPFPIYGAAICIQFPWLDADGDLVAGVTGADTEVSKDLGTYTDCTNEATEVATDSGMHYLDLTYAEMQADCVGVISKGTGVKTTPLVMYPRRLPSIRTGTCQAGAEGTVTLDASASAKDDAYNGCYVHLTGNTGIGQARLVTDYVGSTKVATIAPNWATNPDSSTTFSILAPETANVAAIAGTAQRATDLAEIAQYLFANSATLTTVLADNSVLAQMLATSGDISGYASIDDAQQSIRDAITAAAPVEYHPDASSGVTTGSQGATTYADTASDNASHWEITDGGSGILAVCEFNMGANRAATQVRINGYFDSGASRIVEMYAWNYTSGAYVKLSAGSADTEMRNAASDTDYVLSLASEYTDHVTVPGEVKIKFEAAQSNNGDVLMLDEVAITGVASGSTSLEAYARAVWADADGESIRHIPKFTGHIRYVDGTSGSDANSGVVPDGAFATIGAAIAASSAGDRIIVKAGTYTETGITLSKAGLELCGEIGTIIDPASGSALTISAANCHVSMIEVRPAAGAIGFDVASGSDYSRLTDVLQSTTGGTGMKIDSGTSYIVVTSSQMCEYTSVGVELNGKECILDQVVCRGDGGSETGFNLNHTNAHRNLLNQCSSIDNATLGFGAVSGADDNVFQMCVSSAGDGGTAGRSDAGANNSWRGYIPTEIPQSNLTQILAAALTETSAGYLAAGVKKFFNIQTPVATVESVNQTGDGYAVVAHADHGNAKLVRSTTPANKLTVDAAGLADANAVKLGPSGSGSAQTARDIGTSVLLSSGSGTGQLDFTSGVVKSNLAQILGTALTETAGYLAAGFKKLFNVATPVLTAESVNQTGDAYAITNSGTHGNAALKTLIDTNKTELDGLQGADGKAAISTDAQDLSATLSVNAKLLAGAAPNNLSTAQVNTEVDNALNTAIPGSPTAASVNALVKAIDALTKASGSGDLAAIKTATDRVTAARMGALTDWINGGRLDLLLDAIPTTGGGDATLANQTLLLEDLVDIKGTGFVKDTNSLVDVTGAAATHVQVGGQDITIEDSSS